jgi:large subunit ribosomal protein L13e
MGRVKCFFNQPAHKKLRQQRRAAKAAAAGVAPISKLRPIVFGMTQKHGSKVRFGRGFSLEELKSVGLTQKFARTVGISVDFRRHNTNADSMATNVERLTQYKNKLILFPKRADKPKKGEINDSTADKLTAAAQNTTEGVFALPKVAKRVKVEPLTDALKKFNAYQKCRTERLHKRQFGRREKAAAILERAKK